MLPRKRLLNDKWLLSRKPLKPDDLEYRKPIWDTVVPGLCVRIGSRPSFYVGKRPTGSPKFLWIKLGDHPVLSLKEARERARESVAAIAEGRPPPLQRVIGVVTFGDVVEQFIETRLPFTAKGQEKRTAVAEEQTLRRELPRALLDRPASSVGHEDIKKLLTDLAERSAQRTNGKLERGGPHAVRKLRASLASLFSWASFRGIGGITANPIVTIPTKELLFGVPHNAVRHRVLEDDELRAVWRAATETDYPYGSIVIALILTGQRLNEIASARWSEISEDGAMLVIPAERMKSRRTHAIPLTAQMQALVDKLPRFSGGDFIFSTTAGKRPVSGFSKMKDRLDRMIAATGHIAAWQIHDIRRTVRTGLATAGVPVFHAELVIGHQQSGVHGVYDRFSYNAEKLDALQRWEKQLAGIVEPPPANLVPLRGAAA